MAQPILDKNAMLRARRAWIQRRESEYPHLAAGGAHGTLELWSAQS
jgi:hypothetical protein